MDEEFFESIRKQVIAYKEDVEHDLQLQMGVSVLMHKIDGDLK